MSPPRLERKYSYKTAFFRSREILRIPFATPCRGAPKNFHALEEKKKTDGFPREFSRPNPKKSPPPRAKKKGEQKNPQIRAGRSQNRLRQNETDTNIDQEQKNR